jgi:hypothetical protein
MPPGVSARLQADVRVELSAVGAKGNTSLSIGGLDPWLSG